MPWPFRRSLPIAGVAVLMAAAPAPAGPPAAPAPHVRPETAADRDLLDELAAHSPTVQRLLERLATSDVVVYVRHRTFTDSILDGRIGIVRSSGGTGRYLIVELACSRGRIDQLVTLGHELRHAVEIADADGIVDATTLAEHYTRIGFRTSAERAFDTHAAREASVQIRRELYGIAVRSSHERP